MTAIAPLLVLALLLCPSPGRAAPEMPATMVLTGPVAAGTAPNSTSPRKDDQVLAFSATDGQLVGSGPVTSNGHYLAVLTRTASFNGMPVVLELMQGRKRYQLLKDGAPAWLPFHGRTLPEKTLLPLQIGAKTAELLKEEADSPQAQRLSRRPSLPCTPELDVNGDGRCDELDWGILGLYGGGVTRSVAHPAE